MVMWHVFVKAQKIFAAVLFFNLGLYVILFGLLVSIYAMFVGYKFGAILDVSSLKFSFRVNLYFNLH